MKSNLQSIAELASFTRRWDPHRTPLAYRLARRVRRMLCHRKKHQPVGRLVIPYDRGVIKVDLGTKTGYEIMFQGYHDVEMARLLHCIVKPGSVCLDVGAHIGAWTLVMAFAAGPAGRVVALEPNPEVAAVLRSNLALNRLETVRVVEAAVAEQDGQAAFYTFEEGAPNRTVSSLQPFEFARRETSVRTVSGPTLLRTLDLARCDVLKIDTTGAELVVLRELAGLLETHRPAVFAEYRRRAWDRFGSKAEDCLELLRSLRYDVYIVKDGLTFPLEGDVPDDCNLLGVPEY